MEAMFTDLLWSALRGLRDAATGLLALLIVFEEWGWGPLSRLLERIGQLPLLRQMEARISLLPPRAALLVFLLPTIALLPIKLLALGLIAHGHRTLGVLVIIAAKLIGTAIVARLFTLTQAALLQIPWFAKLYWPWIVWKEGVLMRLRASWAWRLSRALKRQMRQRWTIWRRG